MQSQTVASSGSSKLKAGETFSARFLLTEHKYETDKNDSFPLLESKGADGFFCRRLFSHVLHQYYISSCRSFM